MRELAETITELTVAMQPHPLNIRVWADARDWPSYIDLRDRIKLELPQFPSSNLIAHIARNILYIGGINAVEVKVNGSGIVLYKDWP